MIYLDNAAAMRPLPCAVDAMNEVLANTWANPNSIHRPGQEAFEVLRKSRETVARCLGCAPSEVMFTSSATESAAIAMRILYDLCETVTINKTEHDAVFYAEPRQFRKEHYPRKEGFAQMLVNNETGEAYYCNTIWRLRKEHPDALIFTDATAAVGHAHIGFHDLPVDLLAADGMKFGAVPGCGILLKNDEHDFARELLFDYPHRPTPPVALIAAFAAALKYRTENMNYYAGKMASLVGIMKNILKTIPGAEFNYQAQALQSGIINVSFAGVEGAALAGLLAQQGVCVSTGAACTTGDLSPSRVLLAAGFSEERARSAIRISIGEENTWEECVKATEIIRSSVEQLRAIL